MGEILSGPIINVLSIENNATPAIVFFSGQQILMVVHWTKRSKETYEATKMTVCEFLHVLWNYLILKVQR